MRHTLVLALAAAALTAFGIGLALRPLTHPARRHAEVDQVRIELASHYYRRLSKAVLAKPTIAALLGALHDHYTTYLSPSEYRLARRAFAGGYGGIGITVLPAPGGLLVRGTMNGPARVAGVLPGDTIITVDGASTSPLSFREAIGRILGRPGSTVTLRVLRDGRAMQFRLVRRAFALHPLHVRLRHRVGVLQLDAFSRGSAAAAKAAVERDLANLPTIDPREQKKN